MGRSRPPFGGQDKRPSGAPWPTSHSTFFPEGPEADMRSNACAGLLRILRYDGDYLFFSQKLSRLHHRKTFRGWGTATGKFKLLNVLLWFSLTFACLCRNWQEHCLLLPAWLIWPLRRAWPDFERPSAQEDQCQRAPVLCGPENHSCSFWCPRFHDKTPLVHQIQQNGKEKSCHCH